MRGDMGCGTLREEAVLEYATVQEEVGPDETPPPERLGRESVPSEHGLALVLRKGY